MARRAATSNTPRKRNAAAATVTPPSRQSKRVKPTGNTPQVSQTNSQTSKYFEPDESDDEEPSDSSASDFEEDDALSQEDEASDPEDASFDSEDDGKRGSARKQGAKGSKSYVSSNGKTGFGSGVEVVTRLPTARKPGNTPYQDHTLHPNTFLFLKDLKKNNDRDWLKTNDADYRMSQKDFNEFITCLTTEVVKKDETIPELPVKDIIFRIYRDVRFSKNKTPYKTYFSAAWSRTGRKGPYAHYYVQIQPGGGTFVGGGLWHPEAPYLLMMRRAIDRHSDRLKATLKEPNLRRDFLGKVSQDEKKIVKAFVAKNSEDALKTKPKGFDSDNQNIDLLRLRSYTLGTKLADDDVTAPEFLTKVADLIGLLSPFITYLNSVVMPDDGHEEESADEDEEDSGNQELSEDVNSESGEDA